ncbi:uncharacterized protein LOC133179712 [Saccostrea echinata]|uniref:uncharacterized protein LOC133179712 n=1 Tax=Saccostrea echinata TaxID=191078 RepID=UPI002A83ABD0|nr:uncharacterized protein LOC133179712 [Saccostrea echinata]
MLQPQWAPLVYAIVCIFAVCANGALSKGKGGYPSRAVVLQGKHDSSRASVLSRYPHGSGFGSIRGNSRSVSGKLNSIDSKRIHNKLQSTVGKALDRRNKNNLIKTTLRRMSKISDFQTMPGLPVGTVSGKKLPLSRHHNLGANKNIRHLMKTGRRIASGGGLSLRSRSRKSRLGRNHFHQRRRGSKMISSNRAHGAGDVGLAMRRISSHGAIETNTGHLERGPSHLDALHLSEHANTGHHLETGRGRQGTLSHADLRSAGHLGAGIQGQHSLNHPELSSNSLGHKAPDAHLIASLLDKGSRINPDVASFLPNFVADEPKIFLDKQSSVKNAYPQIVVGRPEPLMAAPVLPLSLGSDGHVLTSSNVQTNEVLKSVLSTLTSSKSLTQQAIAVLLQSIRNAVDQQKKSPGVGFRGPKIELSPIIHAGANAVTSENIIRIKEPESGSIIVLKTGGQLEISSGVPGKPTFKVYGIKPSSIGKVFRDDTDNDDEKKRKKKLGN